MNVELEYAGLIRRLKKTGDEHGGTNDEELCEMLDEASHIFDHKVRTTFESALDLKFLGTCTNIGVSKMKRLDQEHGIVWNSDAILGRLEHFLGGRENPRWSLLGREMLGCSARGMDFMLGPFQIDKVRKATSKMGTVEQEKYAKVVNRVEDLDSRDKTCSRVEFLYQRLKKVQPINYFGWIVDPKSFSRTVENCFHTAFLLQRHDVRLRNDQFGESILEISESVDPEEKNKTIVELCIEDWKRTIEMYSIQKGCIDD